MKRKYFALFLVLCMMITVFTGCKTMDAVSAAQEAIEAAEAAGASVTPEQVQQAIESASSEEQGTGTAQDIINAITDASSGSAPAPSTAPAAPSQEPEPAKPLLRSDGLYCYINDWNNDGLTNNYVMRFYDDGTLIFCSIEQGNPNDRYFPRSDWFDKETDYKDLVSTYELDGDHIEFYTANPAGTVDYWGTVKEDRLVLDSHSNINGHDTEGREYVFFPFSEIQGW